MPKVSATYRALNRAVGKAIHRYGMIADGDRICVGLSGGRDSMTLLAVLTEQMARAPIGYELVPVYIDPGFDGDMAREVAAFARCLGYDVHIEKTDHGLQGHSDENRENPCFLCSRLRRKRLFEIADARNCNKLALGHHKDDLIETLFINMCFAGEISTMRPVQPMFGGRLTLIRPLALTDESIIHDWARERDFPELVNPCPSAGTSRRRFIKELLGDLYRSNPKIKGNLFHALHNAKPTHLL